MANTKRRVKGKKTVRRVRPVNKAARGRRTRRPGTTKRMASGRTMARTGTRRAARLRQTLDQRPTSMEVEFADLGPDNSKQARRAT